MEPKRRVHVIVVVAVVALLTSVLGLAAPVSAAPLTAASDTFSRTVANGLGTADTGGAWSLAGTASRFSVAGGKAALSTPAGVQYSGYLGSTSIRDTDVAATLGISALPVVNKVYVGLVARHAGSTEYTGRIVVAPNGAVQIGLLAGATSIALATVPGMTATATTGIRIRLQTTGANPTTVRARAWKVGSAEPSGWQVSTTDGTAGLQSAGSVGIRTYLSSSVTNGPISGTFDDLAAASIAPANVPPVASFTATITALAVAFDASASSDADGTIAGYTWSFGDGATGTGSTAAHTFAAAGTYSVTLTVTDDAGATASTSRSIVVASPNAAPTASFTAATAGLDVTVDGSASSDADGTIARYAWAFGDGSTATGASPAHTYATPGTFTVTLVVTDDGGASGTAQRTVAVATPNAAPTPSFTSSASALVIQVDGSASSDADGTVVGYAWDFGDGATATGATASHTYGSAGSYVVTLVVTDDGGATATLTRAVTVAPANVPPTAAFTASTTDLTVAVDGSASSDPNGSITSWAWDYGDGATGTGATASHPYAAGGSYTVRLVVTDDRGATATAERVVTATTPNRPPVPVLLEQQTGLAASFIGDTSTDPDGAVAAYRWTFGDGATSTAVNPTRTFASAGTYSVSLTVTDDRGATATVSRSVTVFPTGVRPAQSQWLTDATNALSGAADVIDANRGVAKPAIVLDIDNTALQSSYQPFAATTPTLALEQRALANGYTILFATGRAADIGGTLKQLTTAGYRVDALCFRDPTVTTQASKTACRAKWATQGFTIVANVGNHTTDLGGGNSGRQYLLPNYGLLD